MEPHDSTEEFAEIETYIRDIWRFLPLPIVYLTPLGVVMDCDDAFEALVGLPKEKIIGTSMTDFCPPGQVFEDIMRGTLAAGGIKDIECTLMNQEGESTPVSVSSLLRKDASGDIIGCFMAFIDVSARIHAENSLRASEEKYRAAVEQSAENIYILDLHTKGILEANSSLQNLLGYTERELKKLTVYDFIAHSRDSIDEKIAEVLTKQRFLIGERQYRCKDGTLVDVEVSASYITYSDKKAISVVSRNITQRKKLDEERRKNYEKLQKTFESTVRAMSRIVETRDPYTAGHQRRVASLAVAIAEQMGLPKEQINGLYMAALIHDIGKLYIPAEILVKPTQLTAIEFEMVKMHPSVAYDILKTIEFPWPVALMTLQHHERFNGSGYPRGLHNTDILVEAKILALADVVEAMSSHRPYRPAKSLDETLDEITTNKGILYDPLVVDVCVDLFKNKLFTLNEEQSVTLSGL